MQSVRQSSPLLSIKNQLSILGLEYLWDTDLTPVTTYKIFEQRLLAVNLKNATPLTQTKGEK